jgi:hypothetical protein
MPYTVADLRRALAQYPDDTPVILSSDEEGNSFSPLADATRGMYLLNSSFAGEHYPTEEDRLAEENPDEFDPAPESAVFSVFLWPTN